MEENTILDRLMLFGLTRQEASIFLCLSQNGEMTGYEVAKQTGISRSNVYSGLSGLVDKGAAYLEDGNTSKYIAASVEEFCENKIRTLNREKKYLALHLHVKKEKELGYITITGSGNIMDKIYTMIGEARMRIYFSASYKLIEEMKEVFLNALDKKIKLVLITDLLPSDERLMKEGICYQGERKENSIRLIVDSEYALTGELTGSREDTCLYTGQKNFIEVFKDALRNEIKLIELTRK